MSSTKEKTQHTCVTCGKVFKWKISLKEHLRIHSGERPHACAVCKKVFRQRSGLSNHMKTAHSDEVSVVSRYVCTLCGYSFTESHYLSRHIKTHLPPDYILPESNGYSATDSRHTESYVAPTNIMPESRLNKTRLTPTAILPESNGYSLPERKILSCGKLTDYQTDRKM